MIVPTRGREEIQLVQPTAIHHWVTSLQSAAQMLMVSGRINQLLIKNLKTPVFVPDRTSMSSYLVPPPATREGSVSPRPGSSNKSPSNIHGKCCPARGR